MVSFIYRCTQLIVEDTLISKWCSLLFTFRNCTCKSTHMALLHSPEKEGLYLSQLFFPSCLSYLKWPLACPRSLKEYLGLRYQLSFSGQCSNAGCVNQQIIFAGTSKTNSTPPIFKNTIFQLE